MTVLLTIFHVLTAVALILIVLLQTGKGASMGATFGGGSSGTVFGSRGPAGFMSKLTAVAAVVFMMTSLSLSFYSHGRPGGDSIMETPVQAPSAQTPPAQTPPTQTPTDQATTPAPTDTAAPTEQAQDLPKEEAKPIAPDAGTGDQQ